MKKILAYTLLSYLLTWSFAFGLLWFYRTGSIDRLQLDLLHSLGALGPAVAALFSIYYFYGKKGLIKLCRKFRFGLSGKADLLILASPLLLFLLGLLIYPLLKGNWFSFSGFVENNLNSTAKILAWLLPLFSYAFLEEIGWRGFLLPHLQENYSAFKATVYLSIIWGFWHLPFFLYRFEFSVPISIGLFFGIFVGAIILTSLYNSSRGALLPVMLFHFLNNLCSAFEKEIIVAVLSTGFVFIAIFIYRSRGPENLNRRKRIKNYFLKKQITNGTNQEYHKDLR